MKKLVKIVALLLAVMTVAVAATACSVSGKTYVFDKVEITATQSVDSDELEDTKKSYEENYKGIELIFNADGTLGLKEDGEIEIDSYWKEKGNKIYLSFEKDFEIDEEDESYFEKSFTGIIYTEEFSDVTIKVYFKLKF